MGRFSELSIKDRVGAGTLSGKPAEAATYKVLAESWDVETYGLRDVDTETALVARLEYKLAGTPDFVAKRRGVWGNEPAMLVEAQGCEEEVVIVKARKLLGLIVWQHFANLPVVLAVLERAGNRVWLVDLPALLACLRNPACEPFMLDAGKRNQKLAWRLPLHLLNDHLVLDAGAAAVTASRRMSDLAELHQPVG
jgi:hypothetical protein